MRIVQEEDWGSNLCDDTEDTEEAQAEPSHPILQNDGEQGTERHIGSLSNRIQKDVMHVSDEDEKHGGMEGAQSLPPPSSYDPEKEPLRLNPYRPIPDSGTTTLLWVLTHIVLPPCPQYYRRDRNGTKGGQSHLTSTKGLSFNPIEPEQELTSVVFAPEMFKDIWKDLQGRLNAITIDWSNFAHRDFMACILPYYTRQGVADGEIKSEKDIERLVFQMTICPLLMVVYLVEKGEIPAMLPARLSAAFTSAVQDTTRGGIIPDFALFKRRILKLRGEAKSNNIVHTRPRVPKQSDVQGNVDLKTSQEEPEHLVLDALNISAIYEITTKPDYETFGNGLRSRQRHIFEDMQRITPDFKEGQAIKFVWPSKERFNKLTASNDGKKPTLTKSIKVMSQVRLL